MASYMPLKLVGDNLGQRHRFLNGLVAEAFDKDSFKDFGGVSEHAPIDRLFQIELASRFKNVQYILRNFKDDDMLYVSRALKATWLLDPEYKDIINPKYLEINLFPEMLSSAVTKMMHWLYINLRDPERCYEFYEHYKNKKLDTALKFLTSCRNEIILQEFPMILPKITPHYLKVFSEKCPKIAKLYFDALGTDKDITCRYQQHHFAYHKSVMCVLKLEPEIFFYILEKYHSLHLKELSPAATKHIIRNHRNRFNAKPELYTVQLLHMPTLANELSVQENEDLVLTLARAKYLDYWFSYKKVEPLIKRLSPDRRAAFKKRVFVKKDIGVRVDEWPYPLPKAPCYPEPCPNTLDDPDNGPWMFDMEPKNMLRKRKFMKCCGKSEFLSDMVSVFREKTELDRLFEQYRVIGFEGTFHDLSHRLGAAGTVDSRRNMFLVLVSKTGGREENVSKLLQLMSRHVNEPANFRAAIVRSLMKRANVWRLPAEAWDTLMKFSQGLGLDGSAAEADCREGMHAVVLRQLLSDTDLSPVLRTAFLADFTNYSEYSLTPDERSRVTVSLTNFLLNAAENSEPEEAAEHLGRLIRVLTEHRIKIDGKSPVVQAVQALAKRQVDAARDILSLLYNARVARKELFLENLEFRSDDAAYTNLLRHNLTVLDPMRLIKTLVEHKKPLNRFIYKLALYFNDNEGPAVQILHSIQQIVANNSNVMLARPLTSLIGRDLISFIRNLDGSKGDDVIKRRFSVALKAYAHHARPKLNMDKIQMSEIGVKAVCTRAIVCRGKDIEKYINKLLTCRRTIKTALLLAERNGTEPEVLAAAASLRPVPVIKAILRYFRRSNDESVFTVWRLNKKLIGRLDLKVLKALRRTITCIQSIPAPIKADYCATIFNALSRITLNKTVCDLHRDFQDLMPNMDLESLENILCTMLLSNENNKLSILYPNFFVKYLLLCETEEEQTRRFELIGQRFLDRVMWMENNLNEFEYMRHEFLKRTLKCLKYSRVFYNTKYVSCEPVFSRILTWLQNNFKMENYFKYYVELHLTMLYYRAVQQSIKVAPEVFNDSTSKFNEVVHIVGVTFGKLIARELGDLISRYFTSITQLYEGPFNNYVNDYFSYGPPRNQLSVAVMKGILEEEVIFGARLVIWFLQENRGLLLDAERDEIISIIKSKDMETQFFLYA